MKTTLLVLYNLAFVLLLAPLFAGLTRKFRARLHSRQGPPGFQPYFDLFKLLGKEESRVAGDWVFRLAPLLTLMGALAAALLVPMGPAAPLGFAGDGLVLIYLLTLSAVGTVLAGLASRTPFAAAGASREAMLLLIVEPVLAAAFFTAAVRVGALGLATVAASLRAVHLSPSLLMAAVAFFLALQAESAKLPFDIAEAETELMGGPCIEYSGPPLAVMQGALMVRQVVLASFFAALFLPWPGAGWLSALVHPLKVLLLLVLVEVVAALTPRLRIDQAIGFFAGTGVLALAALIFGVFGA